MDETKRYMRLETAAKLYDYDVRVLRLRCLRGQVPGATKDGKEWRVTIAGMDAMMERGIPPIRQRICRRRRRLPA